MIMQLWRNVKRTDVTLCCYGYPPSEIRECNEGVDDTRHYLFVCRHRYATHRVSLTN